jgi:anti-sigma-K factor RskA
MVMKMVAKYDHSDLQELLGAYALDALPDDERRLLEAHLATCETCRSELAELRLAVNSLPLSIDEREPSAALRDRLRAAVEAELATTDVDELPLDTVVPFEPRTERDTTRPLRRNWLPWAVAAIFLLFGLGMLGWNLNLRQSSNQQVIALQAAPGVTGASGELVYLKDQHIIIVKPNSLPALAAGQVYELWLIQGETAIPSGVFGASERQIAVAANLDQYQALAITIEDGPLGKPTPQGQKVVVTPL